MVGMEPSAKTNRGSRLPPVCSVTASAASALRHDGSCGLERGGWSAARCQDQLRTARQSCAPQDGRARL